MIDFIKNASVAALMLFSFSVNAVSKYSDSFICNLQPRMFDAPTGDGYIAFRENVVRLCQTRRLSTDEIVKIATACTFFPVTVSQALARNLQDRPEDVIRSFLAYSAPDSDLSAPLGTDERFTAMRMIEVLACTEAVIPLDGRPAEFIFAEADDMSVESLRKLGQHFCILNGFDFTNPEIYLTLHRAIDDQLRKRGIRPVID
ncbi:MAG: hypothetical protein LBO73_02090 [Holosporaceae bacterium]|jgi:hypothetical protein|nr:hypothetical protein [Holosporaceae bacterium]